MNVWDAVCQLCGKAFLSIGYVICNECMARPAQPGHTIQTNHVGFGLDCPQCAAER